MLTVLLTSLPENACDHEGHRRVCCNENEGRDSGGKRETVCDNAGNTGREFQELHEIIEYINDRQERLLSTLKREQELM